MEDALAWLASNWVWLGVVVSAVLMVAGALVKLTANVIDDAIVAFVKQAVEMLSASLPKPAEPGSDVPAELPGAPERLDEEEKPSSLDLKR